MAHRRTRRQPVIVCLEGTNGCGKTTLAHALAERWRAEGGTAQIIDPTLATDFGKQLRAAVMDAVRHDEISGDTETLAFAAARLQSTRTLRCVGRQPADLLIVERWTAALIAYGAVAEANQTLLSAIRDVLDAALPIEGTAYLDVPGTVAQHRLARQTEHNRFETLGSGYLETYVAITCPGPPATAYQPSTAPAHPTRSPTTPGTRSPSTDATNRADPRAPITSRMENPHCEVHRSRTQVPHRRPRPAARPTEGNRRHRARPDPADRHLLQRAAPRLPLPRRRLGVAPRP